jgi:hypothetical protein
MLKVVVPVVAVADAVSVSIVAPIPGAAIVVVEKAAVTPSGRPKIANVTGKLKPFVGADVAKLSEAVFD